jgi:hypothetical protein
MNWFFVSLPLIGLGIASATIPRLVPAVRDHRTELAVGRTRSNGRDRFSPGPGGFDRP